MIASLLLAVALQGPEVTVQHEREVSDGARDPGRRSGVDGQGAFPMTLRLVMTRNVGGEQMAEAFDGALGPRVAQAGERGMTGGGEALARFRALFVGELASGTELLFSWAPGNTLRVSIDGRQVGEIENAALCWALFDVYLGEKPISSDGKKTVIARLPEILGA